MKLRTFEGEPVRGEMTTDFPVSQDGIPVLLVKDEPFSPEEAEFFIEYATKKEMEMLREGGYGLPAWEGRDEGYEEVEEIESDDDWNRDKSSPVIGAPPWVNSNPPSNPKSTAWPNEKSAQPFPDSPGGGRA